MAPDVLQRSDAELWEEEDWSVLLEQIGKQTIIPIIGPDLLHVEIDGQSMLMDRFIARQLARRYSLTCPDGATLNDVACTLLHGGKRQENLSAAVHKILKDAAVKPPKPLLQLAGITHFNLYVTTTFDSLLAQALRSVRKLEPKVIGYSPNKKDIDIKSENLRYPTVYHLFGESSNLPSYVISEEDLLEFTHALQSESLRPKLLFDELKNKNLLILGENFPDWLARFFLRSTRQGRLSLTSTMEILADSRLQNDENLVLFLQRFSRNTRIFRGGGPVEFVDELWRRWYEQNSAAASGNTAAQPSEVPEEMPRGAVFISYCHEDAAAAEQLRSGLAAEGLDVWFDQEALQSGDRFNFKIRSYVEEQCSCFLMIISQNTERKLEGYFRKEWDLAIERDRGMAHNRAFIMPISVDGTDARDFATLRPEVRKYTITPLPGGKVTPEFVERMKREVARFKST